MCSSRPSCACDETVTDADRTSEETPEERRERLLQTVARLPTGPGVYLFRDDRGGVAYVGKARSLRQRVKSYFARSPSDTRRAVRFVRRYVHTIEFVSTASEHEAFLVENKLVKRHKPAYNVKLRDDKDFLYVRVDGTHEFPALDLARRPRKGRGRHKYYGPFANAGALRRTLRMLGGIIPLRDCSDREFASRTRPCLKHEMGRCCAPCVGLVEKPAYDELLADALAILEGRCEHVVGRLEQGMSAAAASQSYEEAARLRDQIRYLRVVTAPQKVENVELDEGDVVGMHRAGELTELAVLFFRRGALVSSAHHTLQTELPDDELMASFLTAFYADGRPVPRDILVPVDPPDPELLSGQLAELRGGPVAINVPRRGSRVRLAGLAARNAEDALALAVEQRGHQRNLLEALAGRLGLERLPELIECYDVSNTGRSSIVASRVVFRHGEPDRSLYRSYRIKSTDGQDDYGAMREVLTRRLRRRESEPLPDLLLVDGGRSHLGVAVKACAEAELSDLPLAALAKGGRRGRSLTLASGERERVFVPGRVEPIELDRNTPEEYLLQRLRDEAHRFAIGHHRRLRAKESIASRLDDVPGVGATLKKRLLQAFGGTRALACASIAEVAAVKGVSASLAEAILDHLGREPD